MSRYSPYGAAGAGLAGAAPQAPVRSFSQGGAADDLQAKLGALAGLAALTGYGVAAPSAGTTATAATKTGLCRFFAMGACTKGAACNYSHSPEAALLGGPILPVAGGANGVNGAVGRSGQYKGALCKFFQQSGTCSSGAACTYAHGVQELAGGYKQRLCKFYEETGQCMKGEMCTYAHGAAELMSAGGVVAAVADPTGAQQALSATEQLANALAATPAADAGAWTDANAAKLLPLLGGLLSNWQSVGAAGAGERAPAQKTQPCKFWEMGQCIKGDACDFIHGPQRPGAAAAALAGLALPRAAAPAAGLGQQPAWAAAAAALAGPARPAAAALGGGPNSTPSGGQRKGALCKYFQQGVTCHAGSACTYAHGIHELAGGFKQRICKFFDQTGSCSKGDSCTYAHGAHELLVGEALAGAMSLAAAEEQPASFAPASGKILPLTNFAASSSSSSDKASLGQLGHLGQLGQLGQPSAGSAGSAILGSPVSPVTTSLDLSAVSELAASLALGQLAGTAQDAKQGGQTNYKRALCKYFLTHGTCTAGATCTYAHGVEELTQGYKRNLCKFYLETGTCAKGSECTFAHGMDELQAA